MLREVPCPAAVCLGGLAGYAEVADERLALGHLLAVQLQYRTDPLKGQRQTHIRSPNERAFPGGRVKIIADRVPVNAVGTEMLRIVPAQPSRQAYSLKGCVIGPLGDTIVREGFDDLIRHGIAGHQVVHDDLAAVHGHAEEQDFKIGRFGVLVNAALLQIDTGESLQVDG